MERRERAFAVTIAGVHGADHLLKRLFPPLVPIWAIAFGFPLWKLGLIMGARTFGSAIGQAPMGHLSDRYDRRFLLPAGFALMGLGIAAFATVPFLPGMEASVIVAGYAVSGELIAMLLAMLASGIGSSTVHPTGYPLITANIREGAKGRVLGMWGSASKFGDGVAPALVGALLLAVAWNQILVLAGLFALGYAVVLFLLLRDFETRPAGVTADEEPAETGAAADRRVFLYPMLAVAAYFVVQISATAGVSVFLPEFVASTYGYALSAFGVELTPESTASFYYSALLLVAGVAQLGTGRLADRYDKRAVIVAYLGVAALALLGLAALSLSPVGLFAVLVVLGASLYGINPARDGLVSDITPAEREGRTFGYVWTGTLLVSAAVPVAVGYLGDVAGLRSAFAILAGVILLSGVPVVLLASDRVYVAADRAGATRAD